jgi:Domain of unknown function (DUF4190)
VTEREATMTSEPTMPPPLPPPAPPVSPATSRPTSSLAVISLVAGIVSWLLLPFVAGLAAIICGHMARSEIRSSNGTLEGDGLAIAGLVLGWINVVLCVLTVAAIVLFFGGLAVLLGVLGVSGQL